MVTRIEVAVRAGLTDARGDGVRDSIRTFLGLPIDRVRTRTIYKVDTPLTPSEQDRIRAEFTDPVIQESSLDQLPAGDVHWVLTVGFRPGVTDNLGRSARVAIEDLLDRALPMGDGVYTEIEVHLAAPQLDRAGAERAGSELLANLLIETLTVRSAADWRAEPADHAVPVIRSETTPRVDAVDLSGGDDELLRISREGTLSLSLEEMQTIRDHYVDPAVAAHRADLGLPDSPTDVELEVLAQTWSEHCKHKIFNASIEYREGGDVEIVDSLFDTYIRGTTESVGRRVDWLVSVFHDNAGVIRLDDTHNLVFKVETHNSPSALDPYGGAMTGIVGVNRDPFGTGIGAELLYNVWGYCLASPFHDEPLPEGLLHPRRIRDGVHLGVIDGGNQSGIPYGRGWEFFDRRYLGKPLVYCGTVGLMPREIQGRASHDKTVVAGHRVVMVGGRIGKDGIHGATFSSEELHADSPVQAVQIGDPLTQKKMTDFLLEARDLDLYSAITDNGAGGLSSSVGEMATLCGGARIDLAQAPLKYAGLTPWETLLSEAQERMTVAVPPERLEAFMALAARREVEATDLGVFTSDPSFDVLFDDRPIAALDMAFLHDGCPRMRLQARWEPPTASLEALPEPTDHTATLERMLRRLNLCSGEFKARQYDHEVKGLSVVKPYIGVASDVPSDAALFLARHGARTGVVLSEGILPRYSDVDTRWMAICATDLAVRRAVATAGRVGRLAALDNFCWPDPVESTRTPDGQHKLAQLVRACRGLNEACEAFDLPLISGKDSMKNDSTRGGVKISIPPTLLVSVVGVVDDVARAVTLDAKRPGDLLYVLGWTRAELGGTEYLARMVEDGELPDWHSHPVPTVDLAGSRRCCDAVADAIDQGLLRAAHAVGPGGLAAALARTAMGGEAGVVVDLQRVPLDPARPRRALTPAEILYSESGGRFLLSVAAGDRDRLEALAADLPLAFVGTTTETPRIELFHAEHGPVLSADVAALKQSWKETLDGI
jgi:phosphoribosylformylglycinamidine synthase subunit PurSL